MKNFFASLILFAFAAKIFAANVDADFSAANKLYAQGKFADAAAAYEKILKSDTVSSALYFNYGNAEFKLGHLGEAIAAYQKAAQLAPRDDETRANLAFVRNQVQGPTIHESRWQSWLGSLSLNEWTVVVAAAFWLLLILLALKQIRPALRNRLRGMAGVIFVVLVLSGGALGLQASNHFSKQTAVVVADNVTARSGPFDDAQSTFTVHDGMELSVVNLRDDWVQIVDGAGKIGWLQSKQVEVLPGA